MTTKKNTLNPAGALRALTRRLETAASKLRRARDLAESLPREGGVVAEIDRVLLQLTGVLRVVKGEKAEGPEGPGEAPVTTPPPEADPLWRARSVPPSPGPTRRDRGSLTAEDRERQAEAGEQEYRRRHRESTTITQVDIYRDDEGEWCYAAFVGGEFDVSDTLGCENDASEADARREAEAQFPGAAITRVADDHHE